MINRLLIKLLIIALLLILNGFAGTPPCKNAPEAWLQKKYHEYRADFHYLELFLKAYKQIDAS